MDRGGVAGALSRGRGRRSPPEPPPPPTTAPRCL
nr:MAG TPA: hypothetical protein [Caudoviricetes sp.]